MIHGTKVNTTMSNYYIFVKEIHTEPQLVNGLFLGVSSPLSIARYWVREIDKTTDYQIAQGGTITCHVFAEQSVLDGMKLKNGTNTWLDFPHSTFVISGGINYYLYK